MTTTRTARTARTARPASAAQLNLVATLVDELDTLGVAAGVDADTLHAATASEASETIEGLIGAKRAAQARKRAEARASRVQAASKADSGVEAGRYAVTLNSVLRFFRVDTPTKGAWAGYTFVTEIAGDNHYRIKSAQTRQMVLSAIASDDDALARYGREIGQCGVCGRTLTDETSREIGIGPTCRSRMG